MGVKALRIVQLYPKEMNLYGDAGNTRCLIQRLAWRGLRAEYLGVGIGEKLPDFDILLIGGGQDKEMRLIARDVRRKSDALAYAVRAGKVIFGVCGGYQLLGEYYLTQKNEQLRLSGALPLVSEAGEKRHIGNIVTASPFGKLVGFENHSGRTFLGSLSPLGTVIAGYGNNGDNTEGVLFENTFGTYLHGPVLPKNPALADALLCRALKTDELPPLDDTLEERCHRHLVRKFG